MIEQVVLTYLGLARRKKAACLSEDLPARFEWTTCLCEQPFFTKIWTAEGEVEVGQLEEVVLGVVVEVHHVVQTFRYGHKPDVVVPFGYLL